MVLYGCPFMRVATAGGCSTPWPKRSPCTGDSWMAPDTMTNLMGWAATWAARKLSDTQGQGMMCGLDYSPIPAASMTAKTPSFIEWVGDSSEGLVESESFKTRRMYVEFKVGRLLWKE